MPALTEWKVPPANQPRPGDYSFDLDQVLASVVGLHSIIPSDAFSAETLGTERAGNGVVIDDGLVLTIGYLITEAEAVWLHRGDGRVVEGHALGFDFESGFGLVQALGDLDLAPLPLGSSAAAQIGDRVVVGIGSKGPAARAELKTGDVILAVNGDKITSQTSFYRKLWSLGAAGVDVPLTVYHEGVTFNVVLSSTDRARLLKAPRLH